MSPMYANFAIKSDEKNCRCGEYKETKHIYYCEYCRIYEEIFIDNLPKLVKVFKLFKEIYQKRAKYITV